MTDDSTPTAAHTPEPARPDYKGAPLDPVRGPGLGCFWTQVALLGAFLIATPIGVINAWPVWLTTAMLVVTLVLTLFTGQTIIFLLRLVSADRRSRRRPLRPDASRTVGDLSDAAPDAADPVSAGGSPSVRE